MNLPANCAVAVFVFVHTSCGTAACTAVTCDTSGWESGTQVPDQVARKQCISFYPCRLVVKHEYLIVVDYSQKRS